MLFAIAYSDVAKRTAYLVIKVPLRRESTLCFVSGATPGEVPLSDDDLRVL